MHSCEGADVYDAKGRTPSDWRILHALFAKFGCCDKGGYLSEGFSEAVARLLVDHWNKLDQFVLISEKDPDFKAFVLRHIDATNSMADLQRIMELSREQCPRKGLESCRQIFSSASAARLELEHTLNQRSKQP
ncbi:hypothetical protein UUA_03613 [Rhodanobacter thiooxydans LCS2]|nr:hypothetical protein UUA_03613 [Rhodanobacter thiooxydans LCS2]